MEYHYSPTIPILGTHYYSLKNPIEIEPEKIPEGSIIKNNSITSLKIVNKMATEQRIFYDSNTTIQLTPIYEKYTINFKQNLPKNA